MSLTNCRFYEDKYPEIDSFVMVNVKLCYYAAWKSYADQSPRSNKYVNRNLRTWMQRLIYWVKIAEMGAYVKLLEYDNIDGMILLSELSRRRIRSIQKLIRVGRNEVVVVLRVDKEKGELLYQAVELRTC